MRKGSKKERDCYKDRGREMGKGQKKDREERDEGNAASVFHMYTVTDSRRISTLRILSTHTPIMCVVRMPIQHHCTHENIAFRHRNSCRL